MNSPNVSIITICYNSGNTIRDTIKSVLEQNYLNIEYIIVDGGSSDNTLEIIRSFANEKIKLVSEKDKGLYDALNKGFKQASGDIIGILHSDDFYAQNHVISDIIGMFQTNKDIEAVSSSVNIYKGHQFDKPFRVYNAMKFRLWQFRLGMQPPHPGFFISGKALEKVGDFNIFYKISADFDWLLRAVKICKINVLYTDYTSVFMRDGGLSSSGFKSKVLMNRENLSVLKSYKLYSNMFMIYSKYLLKLFQIRF